MHGYSTQVSTVVISALTSRSFHSQIFLVQAKGMVYIQVTPADVFTRITSICDIHGILFVGFGIFFLFGCLFSFLPLMLNKSISSTPKLFPNGSLSSVKNL